MTDYYGIRIHLNGIAKEPIYSQLFMEKNGCFSLDFNKIAPVPQDLSNTDIPKVVNTNRYIDTSQPIPECALAALIEIYKNPDILKKYKDDKINIKSATEAFEKIRSHSSSQYDRKPLPEAYINGLAYKYDISREEITNYGMKYIKNTIMYGYPTDDGWIHNNWGTSRVASECVFRDENTLDFNMNWVCPEPIFKKISQLYPDETIDIEIAEEGSSSSSSVTDEFSMNGVLTLKNGEVIYENLHDKDLQKRIDRYNNIWKDMLGGWGWGKIKK